MNPKRHGQQRLTLKQLRTWEQLGYGMFIHFGMSTFDGDELSKGDRPSTLYAPDKLDVDQWVSVARDAGMRYAILTAKHVAGHALWPTKQSDYHVGTSGNKTDVVEAFVNACQKRGVLPGLYYCTWDNHHLFDSVTPTFCNGSPAFTAQAYREFQARQVEELLTQYGRIAEVWIDIPNLLGPDGRIEQYAQIASLQPEAAIVMNGGFTHGDKLDAAYCWPTDVLTIERGLPCSPGRRTENTLGYSPWWQLSSPGGQKDYYVPGEVCETIGWEWFCKDGDSPRSDRELLGIYHVARERGCNVVFNVPPDRHGVIPQKYADALGRLRANIDRF